MNTKIYRMNREESKGKGQPWLDQKLEEAGFDINADVTVDLSQDRKELIFTQD